MMGYLQRLAGSVLKPGGTIHPILGSSFSAPENFSPLNQDSTQEEKGRLAPPDAPKIVRPARTTAADELKEITILSPEKSATGQPPVRPETGTALEILAETKVERIGFPDGEGIHPPKLGVPSTIPSAARTGPEQKKKENSFPTVEHGPENLVPAERTSMIWPGSDAPPNTQKEGTDTSFKPLISRVKTKEVKDRNLSEVHTIPGGTEEGGLFPEKPGGELMGKITANSQLPTRPQSGLNTRKPPPSPAPQKEPDEIQIHIGRIEVTAVPPAAPRPAAKPASKTMALDEYLKRRDGRAS